MSPSGGKGSFKRGLLKPVKECCQQGSLQLIELGSAGHENHWASFYLGRGHKLSLGGMKLRDFKTVMKFFQVVVAHLVDDDGDDEFRLLSNRSEGSADDNA